MMTDGPARRALPAPSPRPHRRRLRPTAVSRVRGARPGRAVGVPPGGSRRIRPTPSRDAEDGRAAPAAAEDNPCPRRGEEGRTGRDPGVADMDSEGGGLPRPQRSTAERRAGDATPRPGGIAMVVLGEPLPAKPPLRLAAPGRGDRSSPPSTKGGDGPSGAGPWRSWPRGGGVGLRSWWRRPRRRRGRREREETMAPHAP